MMVIKGRQDDPQTQPCTVLRGVMRLPAQYSRANFPVTSVSAVRFLQFQNMNILKVTSLSDASEDKHIHVNSGL